jgi:hypothetical protein
VTTTCPHCKHKSPSVKKDGFTKLFIKTLSGQAAIAERQSKNIRAAERSRDSSRDAHETLEIVTNASTNQSRRQSANDTSVIEEDEEHQSESDEEEFKEGTP